MLVPPHAQLLFDQAGACFSQGKFTDAIAAYDTALQLAPGWTDAMHNRALVLQQSGAFNAALAGIDAALAQSPTQGNLHHLRASILQSMGRLTEALETYQRALKLDPTLVHSYNNMATILRGQERYAEAIAACQQAIAIAPQFIDAHHHLANIFSEAGLHAEALMLFAALRLQQPENIDLQRDLAASFYHAGEWELALEHYKEVLERAPRDADALTSIGTLLMEREEYAQAGEYFLRAQQGDPQSGQAQFNLATYQLLMGDFAKGWQNYEARWRKQEVRGKRDFTMSLWLGEPLQPGARLLLHAEQGLGDAIQFCRYVPMLVAHGAQVILEVPATLVTLMQRSFADIQVIARGDALPSADYHCPLMSLPLAFGTTLETIPSAPRYLIPDMQKVEAWAQRLGEKKSLRVGVICSGAAKHKNDANRSIALQELAPLVQQTQAEFHLIQQEIREADMDALAEMQMHTHEKNLTTMDETAALVMQMDLVISVDTAVAHLAASLGKPVWLLLPRVPEFRWMLARDDSPWYPSMRLFRQSVRGDWSEVMTRVSDALKNLSADTHSN